MRRVSVKAHTYARKGKVVSVKPYVRITKGGASGSLSMLHVPGRNRPPGKLPIGSSLSPPKSKGYAPTAHIPNLDKMPIYEIAHLIDHHWGQQGKGVNFGARPYLDAMHQMSSHKENYYMDPGHMVIRYFLSNASSWKGPVAKAVKAELKRRLAS